MVAKCHLGFDGFDSFLIKALRKIFESNAFPDVTLVGDDNIPIEAHKIILSAHSSVFENAFTDNQSIPILHCKGFNYQDLHSLMQYMYLGEVSVPLARSNELLRMAKYLKISQLGDECNVSEKKLNVIFSLIPKDIGPGTDLVKTENDGELTIQSTSAEVLNLNDDYFDKEEDGTPQSVYDSFEDAVDTETEKMMKIDYSSSKVDNSISEDEDDSLTNIGIHDGEKKNDNIIGESSFEENDYGPDMVGKPLPGFAARKHRSVAYSHYYFVKMKPVDGKTLARCNLCWFGIGQPKDDPHGKSKGFIKVSGYRYNKTQPASNTSAMIRHLESRHPDIMEQFSRQRVKHSKVLQEFKETEKNMKLKREEEIMRIKENMKIKRNVEKLVMENMKNKKYLEKMEKENMKNKRKIDKMEKKKMEEKNEEESHSFNKKRTFSEKYPDYDFKSIDLEIRTTIVGQPKVDFNPCEAVVYSHNYYLRLYPLKAEEAVKSMYPLAVKSSYAICIACAQNNKRNIFSTSGGSTSSLIHHIERKHPELFQQYQEQAHIRLERQKSERKR